jgi:hypothetical protein
MVSALALATGKREPHVENVVWFIKVNLYTGSIEVKFAVLVRIRIGVAEIQGKEVDSFGSPLLDPNDSPLPFLIQSEVAVLG